MIGKLRALAVVSALVLMPMALPVAADEMPGSLEHMIANARTKADQEAIAAVYDAQAVRDREAAGKHRTLASYYKSVEQPGGRGGAFGQMALHCGNLAEYYAKAATESSKLAEMHRKMAAEMK